MTDETNSNLIDPDFIAIRPLIQFNNPWRNNYFNQLTNTEISLEGSGNINLKNVDNRRLLYNPRYKKRDPEIFDSKNIDTKEFIYEKNSLQTINFYTKKIIKDGHWDLAPLLEKNLIRSKKIEYINNKVSLIETYIYSKGKCRIQNQALFGKGNSPEYKHFIETSYVHNDQSGGIKLIKYYNKIYTTDNEEKSIEFNNGLESNSTTRKFKLILGKKRIIEEVKTENQKIIYHLKSIYNVTGTGYTRITTNFIDPKFSLKEVFNNKDQIIEKGIFEKDPGTNFDYYLIYNKITYYQDYILIKEYRNVTLSSINREKSLVREIKLLKDSFNNQIRYKAQIGLNDKVLFYSTVHEDYLENKIFTEYIYENGKVKDQIEVYYQINDDNIIERIEGIRHSPIEGHLSGLIFLYVRTNTTSE
ncbi:hypothetical protein SAMN04487762_1941 [Polaribacter sp. Hel1_33_78]|uniref:hypothetical protein n=1 Tax=Polaribacter sp. Hel1_33_78 TaxID=1336804 RepID=UPI00087B8CC9|nr:hypothetical protein [Polaribacter sp. Hel1_33_78]SDU12416.1 hypothetical protein SAMN04487762_1941 [Polaribacter sp. Hel1_33_78]